MKISNLFKKREVVNPLTKRVPMGMKNLLKYVNGDINAVEMKKVSHLKELVVTDIKTLIITDSVYWSGLTIVVGYISKRSNKPVMLFDINNITRENWHDYEDNFDNLAIFKDVLRRYDASLPVSFHYYSLNLSHSKYIGKIEGEMLDSFRYHVYKRNDLLYNKRDNFLGNRKLLVENI